MALSAMRKFQKENTKYGYTASILIEGVLRAWKITGKHEYLEYAEQMLEYYVNREGKVRSYKMENYSMDQVRMGNAMLDLYEINSDDRYTIATEQFHVHLLNQPRTCSGGFFHKKIYPNQMWLDGVYMQAPFHARYTKKFGGFKECVEDLIFQFELLYEHTYVPETGLLKHAWDESRKMPWCDPVTGQSQEVWARAIGWYVMAIADLLDIIPDEEEYRDCRKRFVAIAQKLAPVLVSFRDEKTKLWYQVVDKGGKEDNYIETSASSAYIYFFRKMYRLGLLGEEFLKVAEESFDSLCRNFITTDEETGAVSIHNVCESAGLGKSGPNKPYRAATYEYYVKGEPCLTDNLHGVGIFLLCATEMEFPGQMNTSRVELKKHDDLNVVLKENAGKNVVVIPKGTYETGPVEIPSHTHLVFEEGSRIEFVDDFFAYEPVETRWEGVNCWAMHPCFFIKDATDVVVEGPGVLDGNGKKWWDKVLEWKNSGRKAEPTLPIERKLAELNPDYRNQPGGGGGRPCQFLRPPLLQIINSNGVQISGIRLTKSPFWTLHPVTSRNIVLKNLTVINPYESPNTDGVDIESCINVRITDSVVEVGDDGIAVKSGNGREMMKYGGSENILMENCTIKYAHGGFVIGSETAGGAKNVEVRNCKFIGTDRGVRIKTRRGRGGKIENITISHILMDNVSCPVAINEFYNCGTTRPNDFSLEKLPVEEDTPEIKNITIENIKAIHCEGVAGFLVGLPEKRITGLVIRDSVFELTPKVRKNLEIEMYSGIPDTDYRGIRVLFADLQVENVKVNTNPPVRLEM